MISGESSYIGAHPKAQASPSFKESEPQQNLKKKALADSDGSLRQATCLLGDATFVAVGSVWIVVVAAGDTRPAARTFPARSRGWSGNLEQAIEASKAAQL